MRREIHQRYTGIGWTGIFLFAAGCILAGWKAWIVFGLDLDLLGRPKLAGELDYLFFGIGGILQLVALPMILIGRAYDVYEIKER